MSLNKPLTPCQSCIGWSWASDGYVPAHGEGKSGVLIVAEAAGADEALEGIPLVGKAGHYFFSNLARVRLEREQFRVHNVLSCRPPNNRLAKEDYEESVIASCSGLLDATIADMQLVCKEAGTHFTILTLGRIAFRRILGLSERDPILREDYLCYPFWSERYQAYVIASDHPSYLMRGSNHLLPILQFAATRAVEIASKGVERPHENYMLDPLPATFEQWVRDYIKQADSEIYLSYDIETPRKQGASEEDVAREDDEDFSILRCSFAYKPGEAVSVPWNATYLSSLEEIFGYDGNKVGWNSANYDDPRIKAQLPMAGATVDGMLAWHVLNSALPKSLGFVTPFYVHDIELWKHLSDSKPAYYNAKDADMALRNFLGIKRDLEKNGQWGVFDRHVIQLNKVLGYMSSVGVLRDEGKRKEAEVTLSALLDETEKQMEAAVPQEARKLHVYKKTPKDTTGLVIRRVESAVRRCSICGLVNPTKPHFKTIRRPTEARPQNPCAEGAITVSAELVERWAKVQEFKVSKVSLQNYQKALKHQAIYNRHEQRITFDANAIEALQKKYPKDPLYPLILKNREYGKLLSTYIGVTQENGSIRGGMDIGRDGRIHSTYTHNPSTLRLASQQPNLENLPRSNGDATNLGNLVRNLIIAGPGMILIERDYSAIEAVLVGYFAGSADYIRLAKLGIHSYLASHVLDRPADLSWSDADLKAYFKDIKKSKDPHVELIYNGSKRAIHLSGYGGTPKKMHLAEPETFKTVKDAERLQGIYFDLFPAVKKWQLNTQLQAEKDGFLRNPYGYVHRFYRVFTYKKEYGKWVRYQGDDANKVLAFLPQSTAAGILKEAMLRLYVNDLAWPTLRIPVHDSLVCEVLKEKAEEVGEIMKMEMEAPIQELRLPKSYELGDYLTIQTDLKIGSAWGGMS